MAFATPFDVIARRRRAAAQNSFNTDNPYSFNNRVASQVGEAEINSQAQALGDVDEQAQEKAQAQAQQKTDDQNQNVQDRVYASNLKKQGVLTDQSVQIDPTTGRARSVTVPQTNPDGTTAYEEKDLGIQNLNGTPYSVRRNQWGAVDYSDPYQGARVLNAQGRTMQKAVGKGTTGLPAKDVSNDPEALEDPNIVSGVLDREQKIVGKAAKDRVNKTVVVDAQKASDDVSQRANDLQNAQDALQKAEKQNPIDEGLFKAGQKTSDQSIPTAVSAVDEAKQNLRNTKNIAISKRQEAQQAKADPLSYLQDKQSGASLPAVQKTDEERSPGESQETVEDDDQKQPVPAAFAPPAQGGSASGPSSPPPSPAPGPQQPIQPSNPPQSPAPTAGDQSALWGFKDAQATMLNPQVPQIPDSALSKSDDFSTPRSLQTSSQQLDAAKQDLADQTAAPAFDQWGRDTSQPRLTDDQVRNRAQLLSRAGDKSELDDAYQTYKAEFQQQNPNLNAFDSPLDDAYAQRAAELTGKTQRAYTFAPLPDGKGSINSSQEQLDPVNRFRPKGDYLTAVQQAHDFGDIDDDQRQRLLDQARAVLEASNVEDLQSALGVSKQTAQDLFQRKSSIGKSWSVAKGLLDASSELLAGLTGAAAGSEVPITGNIAGFMVGSNLGRTALDKGLMSLADSKVPFVSGAAKNLVASSLANPSVEEMTDTAANVVGPGIKTLFNLKNIKNAVELDSLIQGATSAEAKANGLKTAALTLGAGSALGAALDTGTQLLTTGKVDPSGVFKNAVLGAAFSSAEGDPLFTKANPDHESPDTTLSKIKTIYDESVKKSDQAVAAMQAANAKIGTAHLELAPVDIRNQAQELLNGLDQKQAEAEKAKASGENPLAVNNALFQVELARRGVHESVRDQVNQALDDIRSRPEGETQLSQLDAYNKSLPEGTPKASVDTVDVASDLAPRDSGVAIDRTLPVAHEIEQLPDPDQQSVVKAVVKVVNGRELTAEERNLLVGETDDGRPVAVDSETGKPLATEEKGGNIVITDAGLDRVRELVPSTGALLPRNEQAHREAPEPSDVADKGINDSLKGQLENWQQKTPDAANDFSKVPTEQLQVQRDNIESALARAKERGAKPPESAQARLNQIKAELDRRAPAKPSKSSKIEVRKPVAKSAGPAAVGDEVSYRFTNPDTGSVETSKGEVVGVGAGHYRLVDTGAHEGLERKVQFSDEISRTAQTAPEPEPQKPESARLASTPKVETGKANGSGDKTQSEPVKQQFADVHHPKPEEAHAVVKEALNSVSEVLKHMGADPAGAKVEDTGRDDRAGISIDRSGTITIDPKAVAANLERLASLGKKNGVSDHEIHSRQIEWVKSLAREEMRHLAVFKVAEPGELQDIFKNLVSRNADRAREVAHFYGLDFDAYKKLKEDPAGNRYAIAQFEREAGGEYVRMLLDTRQSGHTTEQVWRELANDPKARSFLQRVVDYLKEVASSLKAPNDQLSRIITESESVLDQAEAAAAGKSLDEYRAEKYSGSNERGGGQESPGGTGSDGAGETEHDLVQTSGKASGRRNPGKAPSGGDQPEPVEVGATNREGGSGEAAGQKSSQTQGVSKPVGSKGKSAPELKLPKRLEEFAKLPINQLYPELKNAKSIEDLALLRDHFEQAGDTDSASEVDAAIEAAVRREEMREAEPPSRGPKLLALVKKFGGLIAPKADKGNVDYRTGADKAGGVRRGLGDLGDIFESGRDLFIGKTGAEKMPLDHMLEAINEEIAPFGEHFEGTNELLDAIRNGLRQRTERDTKLYGGPVGGLSEERAQEAQSGLQKVQAREGDLSAAQEDALSRLQEAGKDRAFGASVHEDLFSMVPQASASDKKTLEALASDIAVRRTEFEGKPKIPADNALKAYRKLSELKNRGETLTSGQQITLEQAEKALGQKFLLDFEQKKASMPVKGQELKVAQPGEKARSVDASRGLFDESGAGGGRFEIGKDQGRLFGGAIDDSGNEKYPFSNGTKEEYRRNLARSIESAENDDSGLDQSGGSLRNNSETIRRMVEEKAIRQLSPAEVFRELKSSGVGPDVGGDEHSAHLHESSKRFIKVTKNGEFGARGNFFDYLKRIQENNQLWDDDIRLEGVIPQGDGSYAAVTSQPGIKGRPATGQEISDYFREKGFKPFTDKSWWNPATETLINDVQPKNVLKGTDGKVHPIDVIPEHPKSQNRLEMIERVVARKEEDGQAHGGAVDDGDNLKKETNENLLKRSRKGDPGAASEALSRQGRIDSGSRRQGKDSGLVEKTGASDSGRSQGTSPETQPYSEAGLRAYYQLAGKLGKILKATDFPADSTRIGGGAEHTVFLKGDRVWKVLNSPRDFGISVKHRSITSPADYLKRWDLANKVFDDDARWEGVIPKNGTLYTVVSQPFFKGERPSEKEVSDFLENKGFKRVHDGQENHWYRKSDNVLVSDAAPRNLIKSADGDLKPIDVGVEHPDRATLEDLRPGQAPTMADLAGHLDQRARDAGYDHMSEVPEKELNSWIDQWQKDNGGGLHGGAIKDIHTPEFKNWFGDWENTPKEASKVVDEDGKPLVVYHGTPSATFSTFDVDGSQYGLFGKGSYFTSDLNVAKGYAYKGRPKPGEKNAVYPVYLDIKNPIEMEKPADLKKWEATQIVQDYGDGIKPGMTNEQVFKFLEENLSGERIPDYEGADMMQDALRSMGYDGVTHIGGGRHAKSDGSKHQVWIAFEPEQIKSSNGNRGTFDPTDANISHGGAVEDPDRYEKDRDVVGNFHPDDPETWPIPDKLIERAKALQAKIEESPNNGGAKSELDFLRSKASKVVSVLDKRSPEKASSTEDAPSPLADMTREQKIAQFQKLPISEQKRLNAARVEMGRDPLPTSEDQIQSHGAAVEDPAQSELDFSGEPKQKEDMFTRHLGLADGMAKMYGNTPGVQPEDIQQESRIALARAAKTFDSTEGTPFGGYAHRVIDNHLKSLYGKQARRAAEETTLDAPLHDEGDTETAKDMVPDRGLLPSQRAEKDDTRQLLQHAIDRLENVSGRSAINGILEGKTYQQIGDELGVTKQRVGQIVADSMQELRRKLISDGIQGVSGEGVLFGGGVGGGSEKPSFEEMMRRQGASHEDIFQARQLDDAFGNPSPARRMGEKIFGRSAFLREDVAPTLDDTAKAFSEAKDDLLKVFAPTRRGEAASLTGNILREELAKAARNRDHAEHALRQARLLFEARPLEDNLDFIDGIEQNVPQKDKSLDQIAAVMRKINNERRDAVRSMPAAMFKGFIENYFPHIWKDGEGEGNSSAGRYFLRKIEGSRAFLKHRVIPTVREGIDAGLQLKSSNPVDMFLMRWSQMDKFVAGQNVLAKLKELGIAQHFEIDSAAPDGWVRIDKRIGSSEEEVPVDSAIKANQALLDKANGKAADMRDETRRKQVPYYAPAEAAQVLNNYLSPGLRDKAYYRLIVGAGNTLNQAQLGLSAFHLGFTSVDAATSKLAYGIEELARGKGLNALKAFAQTPLQLGSVFHVGAGYFMPKIDSVGGRMHREWMTPGSQSPEIQQLVQAVVQAGGRVQQDPFYANQAWQKMVGAFKQGNYFRGITKAPFALIEKATAPVMEYVVPRQKLGIFADLARREIDKLGPDASQADVRRVMAKAWDSVDNRMGQMVYDNLFWNKTAKDLALVSTRSVGWNLGTFRELGGGVGDWAMQSKRLLTGQKAELTHRMAYTLALPLLTGTMGAIMQYLMTGKGPDEVRDYFYPKTGELDETGHHVRLALPSYMKDVYGFSHDPGHTLTSKIHPLWGMVAQMLQNKDFYGTEIRHPDDPFLKQVASEIGFVGKQFVPFAISGQQKMAQAGESFTKQALPFIGVTPAPKYVDQSPAENLAIKFAQDRMPQGSQTQEAFQKNQARNKVLNALSKGDTSGLKEAVDKGVISPNQIPALMKESKMTPLQRRFQHLSYDEAAKVWEVATSDEKNILRDQFARKLLSAQKRGEKVDFDQLKSPK